MACRCGIIKEVTTLAVETGHEVPPMPTTRPKTKIVCTLGPATDSDEVVGALVESGMSIARLNLSHGSLDDHRTAMKLVRQVSERLDIPVGIMVDVPGKKYRTGPLGTGVVNLQAGDAFTLTSQDLVGGQRLVSVAPAGIHRDAEIGQTVLLDDGLMEFRVTDVQGTDVACEVVRGGRLPERRGVVIPGTAPTQIFPARLATAARTWARRFDWDASAERMAQALRERAAAP